MKYLSSSGGLVRAPGFASAGSRAQGCAPAEMIALNVLRMCACTASRRAAPVAFSLQRNLGANPLLAAQRTLAAAAKGKKQADGILNAGIQASEMRVVYTDPETQKDTWKIMSKQEALQLAQSQNLDLILGSACVPRAFPAACT